MTDPGKISFDKTPFALQTANKKWIVVFELNSIEFSSQEIDTLENAGKVMQNVHDRVSEWATGGEVWLEEPDTDSKIPPSQVGSE